MHKIQVYRDKRNLGFEESAKLLRRAAKAALKAEGVMRTVLSALCSPTTKESTR